MSVKISNLPAFVGSNNQTGDIPISINGVTYRVNPIQLLPSTRPYKVFTALLTQSGTNNPQSWSYEDGITIGATYTIANKYKLDVTNIGAPNNNVGTSFIATGTEPTRPGVAGAFTFDPGAPVATVLENTIGNVWFTYNGLGTYQINSNNLFISGKSTSIIGSASEGINNGALSSILNAGNNTFVINTAVIISGAPTSVDGELELTPIEIRVYN